MYPRSLSTESSNDRASETADRTQGSAAQTSMDGPARHVDLGAESLAIPQVSPRLRYASTTDDDDSSYSGPLLSMISAPRKRIPRPLHLSSATVHPLAQVPSDQYPHGEWDYTETATWGWVILILTWVVFTVGMGSCLGIWSWAWDIGETPYAPPELEDDPTLPIVGYYPALIILSTVMAWVWVIVAWVGMKHFRHAKVGVEA